LFKKAVVSCHRFITEADAGTFIISVLQYAAVNFTAWHYRSAILYNTFYQPAGNNLIALHP